MAEYDKASTFLGTARAVLSQIIQHNHLSDASINELVRNDLSAPSLTLKWETDGGMAQKNISVSVLREPWESIAEVEIGAWKDIERREDRGEPRKFRRMVSRGVETLRNIEQYDNDEALHELSAALWYAFAQASQLDLQEFPDELE
jgi:hypothetical protein